MINEHYPSIPPHMATIGTTVHLLDLELGHNKDQLLTKIYRDPKIDEYELPNKFEYHTNQPSRLLKAALKHAVQCCSNETDFHNKHIHLRLAHVIRGFSSEFFDQHITEFYNEFGIETKSNHFLCHIIPYKTLRQRVLDNYEQQMELEKQQQNEKQKIIRVPYPSDWDAQMALNIKNDLLNILINNSSNKEAFNDLEFEFVPRPQTPLKYIYNTYIT
jgi:hypothetical protein